MCPVGLTTIPARQLPNAAAYEADVAASEEAQERFDLANHRGANEALNTAATRGTSALSGSL